MIATRASVRFRGSRGSWLCQLHRLLHLLQLLRNFQQCQAGRGDAEKHQKQDFCTGYTLCRATCQSRPGIQRSTPSLSYQRMPVSLAAWLLCFFRPPCRCSGAGSCSSCSAGCSVSCEATRLDSDGVLPFQDFRRDDVDVQNVVNMLCVREWPAVRC